MKPTIVIGLLGSGKHGKKMEGGLLEPEMEMPEAMMDKAMNAKNKANAVMKASYGPATGADKCKHCEYFKTEYPELKKGEGFCELWEFTCSEKNVCAAYQFNEELKGEEEDKMENKMDNEMEGED